MNIFSLLFILFISLGNANWCERIDQTTSTIYFQPILPEDVCSSIGYKEPSYENLENKIYLYDMSGYKKIYVTVPRTGERYDQINFGYELQSFIGNDIEIDFQEGGFVYFHFNNIAQIGSLTFNSNGHKIEKTF